MPAFLFFSYYAPFSWTALAGRGRGGGRKRKKKKKGRGKKKTGGETGVERSFIFFLSSRKLEEGEKERRGRGER